VINTIICFRLV